MVYLFSKHFELFILRILFFLALFTLWTVYRYYHTVYHGYNQRPKYILNWHRKILYAKIPCKRECIYTNNRNLLGDYRNFDAIMFIQDDLNKPLKSLPQERNPSQIYIFFSIESASNYPACEVYHDNFFNLTFTYKLDSDVQCPYFVVQNLTRHVVAPSIHVNWIKSDKPISPKVKDILQRKTKAVAWIVNNCKSGNLEYITFLQQSLFRLSMHIDIYGQCTNTTCSEGGCDAMLYKDYYFFIAFESYFSEDYVTEKVLYGYDNYVVPIVYGSANYSRFLPPGSYINARDYHPYNLAFLIKETINDPSKFEHYFNWTNSYTITDRLPDHNPFCDLCETLYSDKVKYVPARKEFRLWWNGLKGMKWCLPEYWNETVNLYAKREFMNVLAI